MEPKGPMNHSCWGFWSTWTELPILVSEWKQKCEYKSGASPLNNSRIMSKGKWQVYLQKKSLWQSAILFWLHHLTNETLSTFWLSLLLFAGPQGLPWSSMTFQWYNPKSFQISWFLFLVILWARAERSSWPLSAGALDLRLLCLKKWDCDY